MKTATPTLTLDQTRLLEDIRVLRDTILRPQRHTGRGGAVSRESDREAYAETLMRFQAYCEEHDVSFALTLKRLADLVMGDAGHDTIRQQRQTREIQRIRDELAGLPENLSITPSKRLEADCA